MISKWAAPAFYRKAGYLISLQGLGLVLALAVPHPLGAQSIHGILVEEGTEVPISGAAVHLLDDVGESILYRLTGSNGRFVLSASAPGTYTLRVDRIGYESITSPQLRLDEGQVLVYRMEMPARVISLEGIEVTSRKRCTIRPGLEDGAEVARVWEEARKALAATAWTQRERAIRFDAWSYTRRLEGPRNRVAEETGRPRTGFFTQPYRSLSAEELAEQGYVREVDGGEYYDFFAPDAEVLLSDLFLDHHCFKLVDDRIEEGLIGLGFEPVRDRRVPEIEGTLWLDRQNAELRRLDFRYTGLPPRVPGDGAGGSVDFAKLPNGIWIVKAWSIRTPIMAAERVQFRGKTEVRHRVVALQEQGGEVLRAYAAAGQTVELAVSGTLTGSVVDSTNSGAPLAGARVLLAGTEYSTVTDATGQFRLPGIPTGTYGVILSHPRLDSLPLAATPPVEVVLESGGELEVDLAVPPLERILAAACEPGDESPDDADSKTESGVLVGRLLGLSPDRASSARVSLRWVEEGITRRGAHGVAVLREPWEVELPVDERGRFWVCELPLNTLIRISATWGDGQSTGASTRLRTTLQYLELSP